MGMDSGTLSTTFRNYFQEHLPGGQPEPEKWNGNLPETTMKPMENPVKTTSKPGETLLKPVENPQKPLRNLGGRPKKDREAIARQQEDISVQNKIEEYLKTHDKIFWTIAGMARAVGCKSSRQFIDLAKERGGAYSYGLLRMEEKGEEFLFSKCYPGAIFLLKQLGWEDTQHIETESKTVTVQVNLSATLDDLSKVLRPVEEQDAV